jgi:hypothetical protein
MKNVAIIACFAFLILLGIYLLWPPYVIRLVESFLPAAPVEYVIENKFRGIVKLRLYSRNGVPSLPLSRKVVLAIPAAGILDITGGDPMAKLNFPTARFKDGTQIPFDDPNDRTSGRLVFINLGRYANGREAWYFIGTRAEADDLYQKVSAKRTN